MPRWRDSATFSAAWRQTLQERTRLSPSFHSLVCLSRNRGVEAMRNFATAAPLGVKRSSGSSTAPDVDLLDAAAVVLHDGQELVEGRSDGALLDVEVEDDHELVVTHAGNPPPLDYGGHGLSVAGGLLRLMQSRQGSRPADGREIVVHRAPARPAGLSGPGRKV